MPPGRGRQIGQPVGTRLTIQAGQGRRACRASIPAARSDVAVCGGLASALRVGGSFRLPLSCSDILAHQCSHWELGEKFLWWKSAAGKDLGVGKEDEMSVTPLVWLVATFPVATKTLARNPKAAKWEPAGVKEAQEQVAGA